MAEDLGRTGLESTKRMSLNRNSKNNIAWGAIYRCEVCLTSGLLYGRNRTCYSSYLQVMDFTYSAVGSRAYRMASYGSSSWLHWKQRKTLPTINLQTACQAQPGGVAELYGAMSGSRELYWVT